MEWLAAEVLGSELPSGASLCGDTGGGPKVGNLDGWGGNTGGGPKVGNLDGWGGDTGGGPKVGNLNG